MIKAFFIHWFIYSFNKTVASGLSLDFPKAEPEAGSLFGK